VSGFGASAPFAKTQEIFGFAATNRLKVARSILAKERR
jgi:hypothetical protein